MASVIAPVVLIVVAAVVGGIASVVYNIFTVVRPEIIGFFAALLGGAIGSNTARVACDAILKAYSRRAVFAVIALLCAAGLMFEATLPLEWARLAPVAQLVVIAVASWHFFWSDGYVA